MPGNAPSGRLGFFIEMMKNGQKEEKRERVVTFLNRNEVDFLDKVGKDALFSTGMKVSRAKLIAWIVDFIKKLNVTGENIHNEEEFENKLLNLLKQNPASHGRLTQGGV